MSQGRRPRPRSLFRAVQQDPGEAALAAAHGDQQRAVDDLLHPHGQPAADPRLHAPRPGPAPAPRRVSPARDAARRPPDVTKLRSGRPPRAGRGRGEGRAGHRRPQTRAGPCGLHARRGDAVRSPTATGQDGAGRGRAALHPRRRWRRAPAERTRERAQGGRPGPWDPASAAGGPTRVAGRSRPQGVFLTLPSSRPRPSLPRHRPGFPASGSGAEWPPGHRGEEVPVARAGSPAGRAEETRAPRGHQRARRSGPVSPSPHGGHLTPAGSATPRVTRARARPALARPQQGWGGLSGPRSRSRVPGAPGKWQVPCDPAAAGGVGAPHSQWTMEGPAFAEPERGSPARAAGRRVGGVGGAEPPWGPNAGAGSRPSRAPPRPPRGSGPPRAARRARPVAATWP